MTVSVLLHRRHWRTQPHFLRYQDMQETVVRIHKSCSQAYITTHTDTGEDMSVKQSNVQRALRMHVTSVVEDRTELGWHFEFAARFAHEAQTRYI